MKFTIQNSDGPTAEFVAGKLGNGCIIGIIATIALLAAMAALGVYLWKKKKKEEEK